MIADRTTTLPVSMLTDKEVEAEFSRMMGKMQAHEKARPRGKSKPAVTAGKVYELEEALIK